MSTKKETKNQSDLNEKTDHDQRDKELFEALCDDLVALCHPRLYEKLDFSKRSLLQQAL